MKSTIAFSIFALAALGAQGQPAGVGTAPNPAATPRVDQREANQQRRIEQGEKSGQLTPREASRLEREQGRIDRAEDRAKADGKVTARERGHLDNMQDRASRDIRREKHDGQRDLNHDGRKDRPRVARP